GIRDLYVTGVQTCALPICTSQSDALRPPPATRAHLHPKASAPKQLGHFSCKKVTSKGAAMGAMGADHGPQSCRRFASVRELGARSEERRVGKECRTRGSPA